MKANLLKRELDPLMWVCFGLTVPALIEYADSKLSHATTSLLDVSHSVLINQCICGILCLIYVICSITCSIIEIRMKEKDAEKANLLENKQDEQNDEPIQTPYSEGGRRNPTEDTNNYKRGVEGVKRADLQMLMDWGKSVGLLTYTTNGLTATVFRVGKECVMTAMHVYLDITTEITANGAKCNTDNMTRVTISFPGDNEDVKFSVEPTFLAGSHTLDYAVLKLKKSGPECYPTPFEFQMEATLSKDRFIHVIGYGNIHTTHQIIEFNIRIIVEESGRIKKAKAHTVAMQHELQSDLKRSPSNLPKLTTAYDKLSENGIIPLDVHQEKGVSGAPCVNIDNSYPVVGGMVLGAEPNFYFDLRDKDIIPTEHRIEYAVSMVSIRDDMRENFPHVEADIFGMCTETQMETDT